MYTLVINIELNSDSSLLHYFSFRQSVVPVHVYATILVDVLSGTEMDVEIFFSVRNVCWSLIHSRIL